jgi:hypothetical protein
LSAAGTLVFICREHRREYMVLFRKPVAGRATPETKIQASDFPTKMPPVALPNNYTFGSFFQSKTGPEQDRSKPIHPNSERFRQQQDPTIN